MERLPTPDELAKDLAHLDRAANLDIPFEFIFEMDKEDLDTDLIGHVIEFESKEDRYLHGIITACIPSIPTGSVEENAVKFAKRFGVVRGIMAKNFRLDGDSEAIGEAISIENLNLEDACDFASYYDAVNQANLLTTREGSAKYELAEKFVDYWSFMDKVIEKACEIERGQA